MKRVFISVFMVFVMLGSMMGTTAFAVESMKQSNLSQAETFAMEQVEAFAKMDDTWNDNTCIKEHVALYAPDDTINGYIFRFETSGEDTGFMQIGVLEQEFFVVNLGFEGYDILTQMMNQYTGAILAEKGFDTESTEKRIKATSKIYYAGGFNYYAVNEANKLVSLDTHEEIEDKDTALSAVYALYTSGLLERRAAKISEDNMMNERRSSIETRLVTGYGTAATNMKTMSYWSNYSAHCAPTAAVNMIMYWKHGRGFFASHAASNDPTSVFTWFYNEMETNQGVVGTPRTKIMPAYDEYFAAYSGATTMTADRVTSVTFNKIKTKVDADVPLHLSIDDYENSYGDVGGHSVNVWGYAIIDSDEYVGISENWGATHGYILIAYDSYDYGQYVYYNLNP